MEISKKIPNKVYRLGVARNVALPKGYFSSSNNQYFWLQNPTSLSGVLVDINKEGYNYFTTKLDAERTIKQVLNPITIYEIVIM